jgi:CRISPR-associated endonuclease/helicase Cas3
VSQPFEPLEFTILRHCVTRGADGLSPLQSRILEDPAPVRIFSAPTSAGKSYALLRAAERGQRVVFIVPTRRLAQNLAKDARAMLDRDDRPSRVAVWSSDETARLRQIDATVRVARLRARQVMSYGDPIVFVVATPESITSMLLRNISPGHGGTPFTIAELVLGFDHIVFDEFHSIEARGFGFCALVALACAATPNAARTTFLSATPIDVLPVLAALGLDAGHVALGAETVVTTAANDSQHLRALHGDVRVTFEEQPDILDLIEQRADLVRACLADRRQLVVILDSRDELFAAKDRFAALFDRLGVPAELRLAINSIDDNTVRSQPDRMFVSDRSAEPTQFHVLLATSSIETGVTFRAGLIVMDAGHDAISLVQRLGRVARGDETGQAVIRLDGAKLDRAPWLREAIVALRAEPARHRLTVDRFLDLMLTAARQRFATSETLTADASPLTFRSMPMRAVWAAAVFWQALETVQFGAGQREILRAIRPGKVRRIAALLAVIGGSGDGQKAGQAWIKAFLAEAGTLRDIGATITVIGPDGTRHERVPLSLVESRPSLAGGQVIADPEGAGLVLQIDRRLEDIMRDEAKTYPRLTRPALLPTGLTRQIRVNEAVTDVIRTMQDAMRRSGTSEQTEARLKAAIDLVRCSGLVPAPLGADEMPVPTAASAIL